MYKKCIICGKEFEAFRCDKTCSEKCSIIRNKEQNKFRSRKYRELNKKLLICVLCNKEFKSGFKKKFCSKKCHSEAMKISSSGRKWSKKSKEKQRLIRKGKTWKEIYGDERANYMYERLIERRLRQRNKDTNIEKMFESNLKNKNIVFEKQKTFKFGISDFYLPESNTYVFCDGDYWHNYPHGKPRDSKQVEYLESKGFNVFRFWEHDILNNCNQCINKILGG